MILLEGVLEEFFEAFCLGQVLLLSALDFIRDELLEEKIFLNGELQKLKGYGR